MEELLFSINAVVPIFVVIVLGFVLKKIGFITDEFASVGNKIAFRVLIPVQLFANITNMASGAVIDWKFVGVLECFIVGAFFLLWLIFGLTLKDTKKRSAMIQAGFRSNFVLFGTYLAANLYGDTGAAVVSTYVGFVVATFNVLATFILEHYNEESRGLGVWHVVKKIALNPFVIASALGLLFAFLKIDLGVAFKRSVTSIGNAATPLALMCLGASLHLDELKKNIGLISIGAAIKTVVVPLLAILLFYFLGYRNEMLAVVLAVFATPTAVASFTMAKEQNSDYELAGGLVAVSTLLSSLTLFAAILVLRAAGWF